MDMTPPGPAPVCRAFKKVTPTAPHRDEELVQLWEHDCLHHDGTCGTLTTS